MLNIVWKSGLNVSASVEKRIVLSRTFIKTTEPRNSFSNVPSIRVAEIPLNSVLLEVNSPFFSRD